VQLPTGTAGQVVYLQLTFTANGSNTVTVVNSDNNNTAMVYDGTGADIIVAHMIYTTEEGWVIFSAIEYDN
jgi:predicted TIM-barrel enzyme